MEATTQQIKALEEGVAQKDKDTVEKKTKELDSFDKALDEIREKIAKSNLSDKNKKEFLTDLAIVMEDLKEKTIRSHKRSSEDRLVELLADLLSGKEVKRDSNKGVVHSAHYLEVEKMVRDKKTLIKTFPLQTVDYFLRDCTYTLYIPGKATLVIEKRSETSWCFMLEPSSEYRDSLTKQFQDHMVAKIRTLMTPSLHKTMFSCPMDVSPLQEALRIFNRKYADEYGVVIAPGKQIFGTKIDEQYEREDVG